MKDHLIAIEYQEFGDEGQSVENTHRTVPKRVDHLIEHNGAKWDQIETVAAE